MKGKLAALVVLVVALGFATVVAAQDSGSRESSGTSVQGQAGGHSFDVQTQTNRSSQSGSDTAARGPEGPRGPQGTPGPQGAPGPSGGSTTTVLGMDPTIALLVGLGILAVVIVAIVAASRSGSRTV